MTIFFVSRHPGALQWAERRELRVDQKIEHLDPTQVLAGDTVIGSLPVNLAAAVCARGARYLHLSLELPAHLRGIELTADQLEALGARLTAYAVSQL